MPVVVSLVAADGTSAPSSELTEVDSETQEVDLRRPIEHGGFREARKDFDRYQDVIVGGDGADGANVASLNVSRGDNEVLITSSVELAAERVLLEALEPIGAGPAAAGDSAAILSRTSAAYGGAASASALDELLRRLS